MIKKIFLNIAFVFIAVFVFDLVIGKTLRYFYFKQIAGTAFETSYVIDSTKAEILVFGSSRASLHYVPQVFEDSLGMSCYNAGRNGNFALNSNVQFSIIIKRYTPKIVIFDITPGLLNYNAESYERLSSLLPYYKSHPEIREIIEMRSPYEQIKLLSEIYPFNSNLIPIITGNFEFKGNRQKIIKGYIPDFNHIQDTILKPLEDIKAPLDSIILNSMTSIATTCNQKNIRFVIVTSPLFAKYTTNYTGEILNNFAKINHIEYFNFINDSSFIKKPLFFADRNHMNNEGATKFSQIISEILKNNEFRKAN
jgi:hypothetical protein